MTLHATTGSATLFGLPRMPPAAFNASAHATLGDGALVWAPSSPQSELTPADLTGSRVAQYVAGNNGATVFAPDFEQAYRTLVERHRRDLVAQELQKTFMVPIATDVPARLTELGATTEEMPHYVAGMRHLQSVASFMHRAWQAQIGYDPDTASPERTDDDRELARRYGHPWGLADQDPLCVADPAFPPKGNGVVDAGLATFTFSPAMLTDLMGVANPFTVLACDDAGQPTLVPYAIRFAAWLLPAARALRLAATEFARIDRESATVNYLRAVADAFGNRALFPFEAADAAWNAQGKSDSLLFLRIGPDETYADGVGDTHEIKALFHCHLGVRSRAAEALANKYAPYLARWEQQCAALIDNADDYTAHDVQLQTPEMVDSLLEVGDDIGGPNGTHIAQTLPNWSGADGKGEGAHRGMMYLNKSAGTARDDLRRRFLFPLLDPAHHADFQGSDIGVEAIMRHEVVHNLGPKSGRMRPGTTSDYQRLLGRFANVFEELKAQTGSLYFATQLFLEARAAHAAGTMDESTFREKESWYRASILHDVAWMIGMVQRGTRTGCFDDASTTYPKVAAIQLGFLTRHQGLTYDAENGWWSVNFDQIGATIESLMQRALRLYARSDANAVAGFSNYYLHGDGFQYLHVDRIQAVAGAKPSALFDYQLHGLT